MVSRISSPPRSPFPITPSGIMIALLTAGAVLVSYWTLSVQRTYTYELQFTFQGVEPKELWEHLADFGNLAKANPTIIEYKILHSTSTEKPKSNGGPYEYSVRCKETLVRLPFITNVGVANYSIGTSTTAQVHAKLRHVYWINSTHVVYQNGLEFNSTDNIKFIAGSAPKTTDMQQTIKINCPLLLAPFCKYEFEGQRALILKGMAKEFAFTVNFMEHVTIDL